MHDLAIDATNFLPAEDAPPHNVELTVHNLVFEAGGRRLIDELNLHLHDGGITVVMGPNGAGKSLLLRLLHGLLKPMQGEIRWRGHAINDGVRRRQAMVFQRPVLLRRSVAANIRYALQVRGLPVTEQSRRLDAMLRLARLEHLADRPARVLSAGEQQRLALARALGTSPEILFLDEPTANLDPASTLCIEQLLRQAHADGSKVVLVTHDFGQARRLAHDIVFLHHGRVAEHTDVKRFLTQPQSPAAQAFLAGKIVL